MVIIWLMMVNNNLVGGWALPLWKMMKWKSVGIMNFPTEWTNKQMFQNTNQLKMVIVFYKLRNYNICEILLK
jgi:hypothetical protein